MMCLFKPNTYDPKDWQCPKPSCRTVNFKKRLTCISCGARKPEGANRPLEDWRDGEKHHQGPWDCPKCNTHNVAGAFYCSQCKNPSEEMQAMMEEEKRIRAADEGRGGGLYDRQDPNDKNHWVLTLGSGLPTRAGAVAFTTGRTRMTRTSGIATGRSSTSSAAGRRRGRLTAPPRALRRAERRRRRPRGAAPRPKAASPTSRRRPWSGLGASTRPGTATSGRGAGGGDAPGPR